MRLPPFDYLEPETLEEVLEMLDTFQENAVILAGGTDLLVRMKQRLATPEALISLKNLTKLSYIRENADGLAIGSATPLTSIINDSRIKTGSPALHQAVIAVGAPTIQHHRGTLGGNILQDNRCQFYNQSAFWRTTRQQCHKEGGKTCHAREGSDRCNSTCQADSAPALIALDAQAVLKSRSGTRVIPLMDLYSLDGAHPFTHRPDELLSEIRIPNQGPGTGSAYQRLAYRSAIDYPICSAGVWIKVEKGTIRQARIVIGAMGRAPLSLSSESLKGKSIKDKAAFDTAGAGAMNTASTFAVANVGSTIEYRCKMVRVLVRQALEQAADNAVKNP